MQSASRQVLGTSSTSRRAFVHVMAPRPCDRTLALTRGVWHDSSCLHSSPASFAGFHDVGHTARPRLRSLELLCQRSVTCRGIDRLQQAAAGQSNFRSVIITAALLRLLVIPCADRKGQCPCVPDLCSCALHLLTTYIGCRIAHN